MKKLVARLSQLSANRQLDDDIDTDTNQIHRKQLPFLSMIGSKTLNLEKETSNFLKRGSLDSSGILRALENKESIDNLTSKDKALYQIFNKQDINLYNAAEANLTIYILRKQVKNNLEMRFLQKVIENISIFKQNPGMATNSIISNSLFKQLKHEFYPRRTVLFNYGDAGTKYYIVLKGSVYCLLPDSELTEEQKVNLKYQNIRTSTSPHLKLQTQESEEKDDDPKLLKVVSNFAAKKKTLAMFSKLGVDQTFLQEIRDEQALNDDEYMKKKFPNFTAVKSFGPGESFGEIALMTNKGRSATIVLKDDTHFMSLSKEGFNKVFSIYKQKIFDEQIQFLHNYSFFKELSKFSLLQLLYYLKIESYSCRQSIYNEKDPADYIYLINRGEIEISKGYTIKEQQNDPQYEKYSVLNKRTSLRVINENNNLVVEKIKEGAYENKLNLLRQNKVQKRVVISKQGPNSYFGEQEIISCKQFRESQAICTSVSCEIYIIEKEKLKSVLNEKEYNVLIEESQARVQYQARRISQTIDLKENQNSNVIPSTTQSRTPMTEKDIKMQHQLSDLLRKRSSINIQDDDNTQSAKFVKGVIMTKDMYQSGQISRIDEDTTIPLTPKSLFPAKKKSFLTNMKESNTNSSTATRIQSQSKPRFSIQSFAENQSTLTYIGNSELHLPRSPITSFSSTQKPQISSKLKRNSTLDYLNGIHDSNNMQQFNYL